MVEKKTLLNIEDLTVSFRLQDDFYSAVDDVSLELKENEIMAIVGESGSGKSTIANAIVGLHDPNRTQTEGEIIYEGQNLIHYTEEEFDNIRGKNIGMIFQDPLGSLNPLMTVENQIAEVLKVHTNMTKEERSARVLELLEQVHIPNPERTLRRYPHELSGGMRQRVVIAIALAMKPQIIIADEPTTALDVTIQAQILDLMRQIQEESHSGIILITHDLGVVAQMADYVSVMYAGQIVEQATAMEIFKNPLHPYTRLLLKSVPRDLDGNGELHVIKGSVPSLRQMPREGCRIAPRIDWIPDSAHEENPTLHEVKKGHFVRCTCWKDFRFEEEGGNNE